MVKARHPVAGCCSGDENGMPGMFAILGMRVLVLEETRVVGLPNFIIYILCIKGCLNTESSLASAPVKCHA